MDKTIIKVAIKRPAQPLEVCKTLNNVDNFCNILQALSFVEQYCIFGNVIVFYNNEVPITKRIYIFTSSSPVGEPTNITDGDIEKVNAYCECIRG